MKPTLADRIASVLNTDLPWTIQPDDIESIILSLARDPKAWDQFSDRVNDLAYQIELGEIPAEPVSVPGCFAGE